MFGNPLCSCCGDEYSDSGCVRGWRCDCPHCEDQVLLSPGQSIIAYAYGECPHARWQMAHKRKER